MYATKIQIFRKFTTMKTYKDWLLVGLVLYGLLFTFLSVNSNEYAEAKEIELKRTEQRLKRKDSRIRELLDSIAKQDLAALQAIQAEKIRADRTEEKLTIANEKLKSIRFVRFGSDSARNSAISELYPSFKRP